VILPLFELHKIGPLQFRLHKYQWTLQYSC
jgi:hypothetical protein